uniref:Uncharacterized protein n=1 Tax=Cyanothece sp. (strain PCC 7425 / ATCC 29141) TaxID=395961 RepID=B8HPQ9_CYAP4
MKHAVLSPLLAMAVACSAVPSLSDGAKAQPVTSLGTGINYICSKDKDGTPITLAKLPNANVVLIKWVKAMGDFNPKLRCDLVSVRFENHARNQTLKFITNGTMNGQPIICVAATKNGGCLPDGLLFTLRHSDNPQKFLIGLLGLSQYVGAPPLLHNCVNKHQKFSADNPDLNKDLYLDMNALLYQCPATDQENPPQP